MPDIEFIGEEDEEEAREESVYLNPDEVFIPDYDAFRKEHPHVAIRNVNGYLEVLRKGSKEFVPISKPAINRVK